MKKEAFKTLASSRAKRVARLNSYAGAVDLSSVFSKASNMSEEERMAYIKNFIGSFGLKDTLDLVRNLSNLFASTPQNEAPDQEDEYEPLSVSNYIGNTKRAQMYEGFKNKNEEPPAGNVNILLSKLGDWSVFITFILMLGVAGTSDYNSLVTNDPGFTAEIRAFLLASGSAVMAWAFKLLAKLAK